MDSRALTRLRVDLEGIVLLDLGAGTGIVGELAHQLGVRTLISMDSRAAGRTACQRDRPGL
jgi:predicted RNA methylase